jgi:hypothetical protein
VDVGEFLTFLKARGVRITELVLQTTLAKRVNTFFNNLIMGVKEDAGQAPGQTDFSRAVAHMQKLQHELSAHRRMDKGATRSAHAAFEGYVYV